MHPSIRTSLLSLSCSQSTTAYTRLLPSTPRIPPQCPSRRPFSHTPSHQGTMGQAQHIKPKVPAQMSMGAQMKKATARDLPSDMGLLPGTFVRPTGENMPSVFQDPRSRWQMEWTFIKNMCQNLVGLVAYCKFMNKKIPLRIRERKRTALELHKQMYNAFAEGDQAAISSICCDGLREDFTRRMSSRATPKLSWTLHKYYRSPPLFSKAKIMSDRAAPLPGLPNTGIRQVIVRISSRQSIVKPSANESETATKQKDVEENLVMQRFLWQGKEGEWKVWGMAEETTLEDLDSPFFASGLTISDRLSLMKSQMDAKK